MKIPAIILFASAVVFLSTAVTAQQPCNDETIMNTKGHWTKRSDAIVFPDSSLPRSQYPQLNIRIDKMQKILQAAYPDPKGIEAGWYRDIYGNALVRGGPMPYNLTALFLPYFCNGEKIEKGGETSTWFYVYANRFNWFMEYDDNFSIHKNPVYLLTKKVGEISGYPVYEGINNRASNTGTYYSRAIIITRPGNSPYVPVTRKQYLQLYLKLKEKRRAADILMDEKMPERTEAEQETAKQKGLENALKGASPNRIEGRKATYLERYRTDKQLKEEQLAKTNKRYDEEMKPAKDLLNNMSDDEAKMPAIVDSDYYSKFKKFSTDEEGGQMMVTLNPDYFDSKLPKYVPQFLIVYWRWEKRKATENFKDQIEKNFDFNALKEMIDK